ncbi:MAG: DUF4279 domain-containing protein [Candidatus Daviesbacteria bacterium]|nr:DUF4279 domain-containing protein [Candidatus Daviesbacteria bacterium]
MLYKSDIEEISVSLWISGFEDSPDDITKQLGIRPTETRIKGEERWVSKKATKPMINKENAWILRSELPQSVEPDKHLESILVKIRPHKDKFVELAKNIVL